MSLVQDEKKWYFEATSKIREIYDICPEEWIPNLKLFFKKELAEIQTKLPWLNETPLHKLNTDQVVRFRGMIQDIPNPEFYMDILVIKSKEGNERKRPGRYMDAVYCGHNETILLDSPHCVMKDRNNYLCISIPGENNWVKQIFKQMNPECKVASLTCTSQVSKRSLSEDIKMESSFEYEEKQHVEVKKLKSQNNIEKVSSSNFEHLPISDTNSLSCLLKTYENYEISLNNIIEVVGILSIDPLMSDQDRIEPYDSFMPLSNEIKERALPVSLVPRLHVISLQKLNHCNPLLPVVIEENFSRCSYSIRELIGSILDVAFLGDELAAEYFICHLISSVYIRQDIIAIGKFSINVSGISQDLQEKNYSKQLYSLIEKLVPCSHYFPMTIENMNNFNFVPKKDYETNRLKSGMLQLPKNLHLIIDETVLTCGKLEIKGIVNLNSLKTLINCQKIDYEFQFHKLEQLTDIPVLILSDGNSMLNCDFQIKLDPKHSNVADAFAKVESLLTEEVLKNIRKHLTLGRVCSYTFEENMQKTIQEDFVSSRRHEGGMTEQDLNKLLSLAKFLAQSCGKHELDEDTWKSAKMLETERKSRLINNL